MKIRLPRHLTKTQDPKLLGYQTTTKTRTYWPVVPNGFEQFIGVIYSRAFSPSLFPTYPQSTRCPGSPAALPRAGQEPARCPQPWARQASQGQAGRRRRGAGARSRTALRRRSQRSRPQRSPAGAGGSRTQHGGHGQRTQTTGDSSYTGPTHSLLPCSLPPPIPGKARGGAGAAATERRARPT